MRGKKKECNEPGSRRIRDSCLAELQPFLASMCRRLLDEESRDRAPCTGPACRTNSPRSPENLASLKEKQFRPFISILGYAYTVRISISIPIPNNVYSMCSMCNIQIARLFPLMIRATHNHWPDTFFCHFFFLLPFFSFFTFELRSSVMFYGDATIPLLQLVLGEDRENAARSGLKLKKSGANTSCLSEVKTKKGLRG